MLRNAEINEGCDKCQQVSTLNNLPIVDLRKQILEHGLLTPNTELTDYANLYTSRALQSQKVLERVVNHIRRYEEFQAVEYIWNNLSKLHYERVDPLGSRKNKNDPKDLKNIERKIKRGVVSYHIYSFRFNNETWIANVEEHKKGFEQLYNIYKKALKRLSEPTLITFYHVTALGLCKYRVKNQTIQENEEN